MLQRISRYRETDPENSASIAQFTQNVRSSDLESRYGEKSNFSQPILASSSCARISNIAKKATTKAITVWQACTSCNDVTKHA